MQRRNARKQTQDLRHLLTLMVTALLSLLVCNCGQDSAVPAPAPAGGAAVAPVIVIDGVGDSVESPLDHLVLNPGTTTLTLRTSPSVGQTFSVVTSNPSVVTSVVNQNTWTITASPGRASAHLSETGSGLQRDLGILVRYQDGSLPGLGGLPVAGQARAGRPGRPVPDVLGLSSGVPHLGMGTRISQQWFPFPTVSADSELWNALEASAHHVPDARDRYLEGGVTPDKSGWFTYQSDWKTHILNGGTIPGYVSDCAKQGMMPVFVYYQIENEQDNAGAILANLSSTEIMQAYYKDLYRALKYINRAGTDSGGHPVPVGLILEPDFLAYVLQHAVETNVGPDGKVVVDANGYPAAAFPDPTTIQAMSSAVYSVMEDDDSKAGAAHNSDFYPADSTVPILTPQECPAAAGNNLAALITTTNCLVKKYAPHVQYGWEVGVWGDNGHWVHSADELMRSAIQSGQPLAGADLDAIRAPMRDECARLAKWYTVEVGCAQKFTYNGTQYSPDGIVVDRYGAYGGGFRNASGPTDSTGQPCYAFAEPSYSTWFWNAIQWNNYLIFVKQVSTAGGLPVVLWQMPGGHVNGSLAKSSGPSSGGWPGVAAGALFPDLPDTDAPPTWWPPQGALPGCPFYEDSDSTYFFGDTFTVAADRLPKSLTPAQVASRLAWFGLADPDYPGEVTVSASTVTWAPHLQRAKDSGVFAIMWGAAAAEVVGWSDPANPTFGPPPDDFFWLNQAENYLTQRDPLPMVPKP